MKQILILLLVVFLSLFLKNIVSAKEIKIDQKKYFTVPILMYHHIAKRQIHDPYSVSPDVFDQQMNWLKMNNYQVITYADFNIAMINKKLLPPKSVVISFDDGDVDQYSAALPILKKYNYSAIFFITTNYIGHKQWMDWKMLKELVVNKMEIGGHTKSHPNLAKLSSESQKRELVNSKAVLEKNLNIKIDYFAFPGGAYSSTTVRLLKESGYMSAVTTRHGVKHEFGENLFLVSRIHIDDDLASFTQFVKGARLN